MTISDVIAWKFNNQPGMVCAEDTNGVLKIVEFPGGVPDQATQEAWTQEFVAFGGLAEVQKEAEADLTNVMPFLKAFAMALNDGSFVPGSNYTPAQIKAIVKAKL